MIEIKLLPNSEVEMIGEVSAEIFMSGRSGALKKLSETVEIAGFRKGKAPENVLIKHVGNDALLEKMAVIALENIYPKIIREHKINVIGRPEIVITKIAENNPLGFKIKSAILPEVKLPDYKAIAKKIVGNHPTAMKEEVATRETEEEKIKAKEVNRINILEKIAEAVNEEMPKIMIEAEKDKMLEEMKHNIAGMNLKWEDYLAHIKKTEEELRANWEKDAIKRVKFGLILEKIAETEKIEVPEEELNKEVKAMIDYQKGMGRELEESRVKNYLYGVMKNERVFRMLETL